MALNIKVTIEIEQYPYESGVEQVEILSVTARSGTTGTFAQFPATMINRTINTTAQNACIDAMKRIDAMKGRDE